MTAAARTGGTLRFALVPKGLTNPISTCPRDGGMEAAT